MICEVGLQTGWRIDDILSLKKSDIEKALKTSNGRISIKEMKTGKKSIKYLKKDFLKVLKAQSGRIWVFEGRDDYRKHRSRQAVFNDIKKAKKNFKIKKNITPHSLRKNYAVYLKQQGKSLEEIKDALNHTNILTTMIYALSEELTERYK